jgi:hypothetical protein
MRTQSCIAGLVSASPLASAARNGSASRVAMSASSALGMGLPSSLWRGQPRKSQTRCFQLKTRNLRGSATLSFHQGKWPQVSRATSQPHISSASVLLNCSAVNSSRAPASPMLFRKRLLMHSCKRNNNSIMVLQAWQANGAIVTQTHHLGSSLKSTSQPHMSVVIVVLTCSAVPRSRAPASPMLLRSRLPICKFEHWPRSWGSLCLCHRNCSTPTPPQIASTSSSQPHFSFVSVVLTCSAAPRSRAPASPMLLRSRLPCANVSTGNGTPLCSRNCNTP